MKTTKQLVVVSFLNCCYQPTTAAAYNCDGSNKINFCKQQHCTAVNTLTVSINQSTYTTTTNRNTWPKREMFSRFVKIANKVLYHYKILGSKTSGYQLSFGARKITNQIVDKESPFHSFAKRLMLIVTTRTTTTRPILINHLLLFSNTRLFQQTVLVAAIFAKVMSLDDFKGVPAKTIEDSDKLFDGDKFEELFELLKAQPNWEANEQILWRIARCEFQLAKKIKDQNKDKYQELVNSAYEHVKKSLKLDDKNGLAHKWAAILLNEVSSLQGTKERVLQVLNVRTHMEKAIEYAPTDATSYYLLGEWHFSCYQVSWWERKIASIAFGKLPDADMEVALQMFEKAEEIEKDFYSKNKLMIAKTLLELKRDKEKAATLLDEVVSKYSSSEKWDDKEAVEEANKLLKSIK